MGRIRTTALKGTCWVATAALLICLIIGVQPAAGTEAALPTDPNAGRFPLSSLADFRFLLDPPAGRHGFLRVARGGRFVWPSGRRARFWGVNISSRSVWVERAEIDRVVEVLARSGANMVRFEALDSAGGLLDTPGGTTSRRIDPAKLEILDYWIARLRARGIYCYLNLLDFRQFRDGDGIPEAERLGRAAKPYALWDPGLMQLQKEFARDLLLHRNRHTGLRYADDPALALVEICNEHGFFLRPEALDSLVEPYATGLRQRWNTWLLKRHGSREGIRKAWGVAGGDPVLGADEDPAVYSVRLPRLAEGPVVEGGVVDTRLAPARMRDGVQFLHDVQRAYFREMRAFLREIGVRVPITGVVSNHVPADVASAARELDFTSENYYADHPAFAGREWEGAFFFNNTNPLRFSSTFHLAPWLSALRWEGKPVVVREWATVWPNRYRAAAIPEMAAYAGLQDFDAVLLFGYQVRHKPEQLSDFDHQADPTVWGLFGLGAASFLRGDVQPSRQRVTLAYAPDTLFRWPSGLTNLHRLSWLARLNSTQAPAKPTGAELVLSAGDPSGLERALKWLSASPRALDSGVLRSATGQVIRRTGQGLLVVATPRMAALCGEMPAGRPVRVGGWTLSSPTPIGALMIVSLDGRPLATSRRWVAKMVSRASNTGEVLAAAPRGAPGRFRLSAIGGPPIRTFGEPSSSPVVLRRGDREVLRLGLRNGTWELVARGDAATLACDTPGVLGRVLGRIVRTGTGPLVVGPGPRGRPISGGSPALERG